MGLGQVVAQVVESCMQCVSDDSLFVACVCTRRVNLVTSSPAQMLISSPDGKERLDLQWVSDESMKAPVE